jgi:hypothetical protein
MYDPVTPLIRRDDIHSATVPVKLNNTICQGEQGVVAAQAHVAAWNKFRTALPDENHPRSYRLTAEPLDP